MGEQSSKPASTSTGAVFLSYASEDAVAAERIATALRAAGITVWFDKSELRGGEAWDRQIRKQIHDCALFMPVISANAHARDEGYFRLEWKLAVDRSHLMAADRTFLLPVVIDNTSQTGERIPDRFRELQWSRVPDGRVPPAFTERVLRLLSPAEPAPGMVPTSLATPTGRSSVRASGPRRALPVVAIAVAVLGALGYFAVDKFWISRRPISPPTPPAAQSAAPAAFAPPPHSIAVLPFVNMSGDKEQEYFSDGLSEELLNSLARINELQVAARTSSFYFKGERADLATIAHRLNVASVLEGSVRRSGHMVRVTAQLNNAVTGYHLWSQTYDRNLKDVLQVQTEIANAVATALKVTLLGDVSTKIELGGTRNPAAFDAYLRGVAAQRSMGGAPSTQAAIAGYREAIRLDPAYALAYAGRAVMEGAYAQEFATGAAIAQGMARALADARQALILAPDLPEGHYALARYAGTSLEFVRALEEYERAMALAPGNAALTGDYGRFAADLGLTESGLGATRRAVLLDPLNPRSHYLLGQALYDARRYVEAGRAYEASISLNPDSPYARAFNGLTEYAQGNLQRARDLCESRPSLWSDLCLAVTYEKLGRRAEARALLDKFKSAQGDAGAYQYAEIHAQWGDSSAALDWLEKALRLRDPGLVQLRTDPLVEPLRKDPRFQAVERALKFPQ